MLERGEWEYGSIEEIIAIYAKKKLNRLTRLETILHVKASLTVANAIVCPTEVKFDDINNLLQRYSELTFPEIALERDDAAEKVKKQIKEASRHVLRISKIPSIGDGKKLNRKRKL